MSGDRLDDFDDDENMQAIMEMVNAPDACTPAEYAKLMTEYGFKRLPHGLGAQPSGVGRRYRRLNKAQRHERMIEALEMSFKHNSFGIIAQQLSVSRSTAFRLVRKGRAWLNRSDAQRIDDALKQLAKKGPGPGRPRNDSLLEPDRELYKCHQMAKCTQAGRCLDGNPIAWGSPSMPCSRRVVKSWKWKGRHDSEALTFLIRST